MYGCVCVCCCCYFFLSFFHPSNLLLFASLCSIHVLTVTVTHTHTQPTAHMLHSHCNTLTLGHINIRMYLLSLTALLAHTLHTRILNEIAYKVTSSTSYRTREKKCVMRNLSEEKWWFRSSFVHSFDLWSFSVPENRRKVEREYVQSERICEYISSETLNWNFEFKRSVPQMNILGILCATYYNGWYNPKFVLLVQWKGSSPNAYTSSYIHAYECRIRTDDIKCVYRMDSKIFINKIAFDVRDAKRKHTRTPAHAHAHTQHKREMNEWINMKLVCAKLYFRLLRIGRERAHTKR